MESSSDSYLHKKFKKQLSVEPKFLHHQQQNEKKGGGGVESGEEKKRECNNLTENQTTTRRDNNESVPNQSTNNQSSVLDSLSKSSISSVANLQSANSCISFVVSEPRPSLSFDTSTTTITSTATTTTATQQEPTNPVNTSSILSNYVYVAEDISHVAEKDQQQQYNDETSKRPEPEKSSTGKYVCPYCSLVCSKPSVLQKHIRAHTNERPFPCNSCGFSFKTRSNLYKHCRSRTHANRVMGNKAQEMNNEVAMETDQQTSSPQRMNDDQEKTKPYKPRFHTAKLQMDQDQDDRADDPRLNSDLLSHHINKIINKNNSIVNSNDAYLLKKRPSNEGIENNNEFHPALRFRSDSISSADEPLNLTKNRKRCMSEIVEPVAQKSLIKELLLKNLNSDMQCPHCKMIFQTVTELELHKLRSCKGFVKPGAKYSRSSSVNVASILTQNKNAFDNIPHLQNAVFPLKSPGPFLGKTRLVESDKNKSFSFDDGLPSTFSLANNERFMSLSPLTIPNDKEKKPPVKLFGGEVKITHTSGETKSFKIDNKEVNENQGFMEYSKLSENRVVVMSGLQSGGTVLTNKYTPKQETEDLLSPNINLTGLNNKSKFTFEGNKEMCPQMFTASPPKYTNIMDFSQKAVKLLTPNLKQPNIPNRFTFAQMDLEQKVEQPQNLSKQDSNDFAPKFFQQQQQQSKVVTPQSPNLYNPMSLLVNGKVVRYVPGIPGPVAAEEPIDMAYGSTIVSTMKRSDEPQQTQKPSPPLPKLEVKTDLGPPNVPDKVQLKMEKSPAKSEIKTSEPKKFVRPNSLALKPTIASLKQHHGLTPTMFNQILISPDTPRVAKKYVQQFLHGNYFSYLGLKCSTKPVYCTLNKTQPFYAPFFKKLSMYSEWRQLDTNTNKWYASAYSSRQKQQRFTTAGKAAADLVVHSSYKFVGTDSLNSKGEKLEDQQKTNTILGGYECNDEYTYIRGRGRGRYVCDQCGIRCKKPSMLKKHIRTHSNDRPYTCSHCNFSFKTKGNLTKHMKSKAHSKNYVAGGSSSSSTQQSGTQSSDSDTDDSGMDSSDESTRREEHEAAYGLLSLAQKSSTVNTDRKESSISNSETSVNVMNTEEIAYVFKSNYAKNKILDEKTNFSAPKNFISNSEIPPMSEDSKEIQNLTQFLGKTTINRPLTYPYTSITDAAQKTSDSEGKPEPKSIQKFHVIQKYAAASLSPSPSKVKDASKIVPSERHESKVLPPILKVNDVVVDHSESRKRKMLNMLDSGKAKISKTDSEVMDLSVLTKKNVRLNGSPTPTDDDIIFPPLNPEQVKIMNNEVYSAIQRNHGEAFANNKDYKKYHHAPRSNGNTTPHPPLQNELNVSFVVNHEQRSIGDSPKSFKEYDISAMETLAEIATKQGKLDKNTMAKSVASQYMKLTAKGGTKSEFQQDGERDSVGFTKNVSDLIVKPEGSKSCHICLKSFSKPSQLRLHMNIHYLERPFRCHSCSVSFRTKGHLQKHERSASHHNKLSSSPALSSSEPRPFKCNDCNIAFRIHGHLAKHLRSKMHIMKLECLAKIPFGLYAELERSNSLLTEINTADGDQCLESLKTLAKKVFINDPNKLNQLTTTAEALEANS